VRLALKSVILSVVILKVYRSHLKLYRWA